jgi:hypothetical protein
VTQVVNLYGGPGTGKSTSAAYVYFLLKQAGKNVELVREYVKDWAWEGRAFNKYDQMYFAGKQIRKESMLYGKVDFIVTDSPVMLGIYYSARFSPPRVAAGIKSMTLAYYDQARIDNVRHHHVMLERTKGYNPSGRYQTEEEAKTIDNGVFDMLINLGVSFENWKTDEKSLTEKVHATGWTL